jgi:hypothetical protein
MTAALKEQFLAALAEQKALDETHQNLARRVGQLVKELRTTGNQQRILLELDGEVWTVERDSEVVPASLWLFRFKKEGKLA